MKNGFCTNEEMTLIKEGLYELQSKYAAASNDPANPPQLQIYAERKYSECRALINSLDSDGPIRR